MSGHNLQRINPKHQEIMHRLILGQSQHQIAQDFGMNESYLSQIVNAPLFQVVLKRMQERREEKLFETQEHLFEAARLGAKLHKEVIADPNLPLPARQISATSVLNIVGRITEKAQPLAQRGVDVPYERRLREVTIREEFTSHVEPGAPNGGNNGGVSELTFEENTRILTEPEQLTMFDDEDYDYEADEARMIDKLIEAGKVED